MDKDIQTRVEDLSQLGIAQLRAISEDFRHPEEVQEAARDLIRKINDAKLRAVVGDFNAATPAFAELTRQFVDLTVLARTKPGGDAVATLNPIVRQLGEIFSVVTAVPAEHLPVAGDDKGVDGTVPNTGGALPAPPPKGTVNTSTRLADIAGEYDAMFAAMKIDPAKLADVDRLAKVLASFRSTYDLIEKQLRIPWHFVGLLHCMESSFNFGTHLHNGDSLMHRTVNVPAGRPSANVADPPFAWTTSAIDALTLKNFQTQTDWSIPAQLFRLEKYNGYGYRFKGRTSPYLWSFSDLYTKGKFVKDGVYDENAVSKQCGAAVVLKRLVQNGIVTP